jgi:membrane-associated phospholipid phosphatase
LGGHILFSQVLLMKKYYFGSAVSVLLFVSPAQASEKGWADAGTAAEIGLVVIALGAPAVQEDWNGDLQAAGSIAAAGLITQGLKETFPKLRPDGSDNRSFPSGHTSVSFAAAATITNRYGWKAGLPAQVVAAFVGLSRIEARKHDVADVLVGAAIGETSGFLITSKRNNNVQVFPWASTKSAGISVAARF